MSENQNEEGYVSKVKNASQQGLENVKETASVASEQAKTAVQSVRESVSNTMGNFSNINYSDASREFLESNTIIAKIAFILLVLIIFFFTLRICMAGLGFFLSPPVSPYLVSGTMSANQTVIVSQNPQTTDSVNILRSNNQSTGVEFTWSVWLLVQPSTASNQASNFQNVFVKGDGYFGTPTENNKGLSMVDNGPGLYILNNKDGASNSGVTSLVAVMDVHNPSPVSYNLEGLTLNSPYVVVNKIPINKWFHVALRLQNTLLDLYINGVLYGRTILQDVPKQNYGDVTVCGNNGFSGKLSNLRYYNHALNVFQIGSIAWWGPNTKENTISDAVKANNGYTYLSSTWYNENA